ncbi:RICIN domain-containing protein [Streptomyces sp. NPDC058818]|uniref:RICIN domain-containing protein n=1 Tax=Streptomyces sp. NPDC058818 TaxID=3346640 RepID=UPI0036C14E6B
MTEIEEPQSLSVGEERRPQSHQKSRPPIRRAAIDINATRVRSSSANGTPVTQRTCSTEANQQWRITNVGGGYYRITARHSGKCLDIRYGSTTVGAQAIQYTCKESANQQWQRTRAPY